MKFNLKTVLSATTGVFLTDLDSLFGLLNHCTGEPIYTHMASNVSFWLEPRIKKDFPELAGIEEDLFALQDSVRATDNVDEKIAAIDIFMDSLVQNRGLKEEYDLPVYPGFAEEDADPLSTLIKTLRNEPT